MRFKPNLPLLLSVFIALLALLAACSPPGGSITVVSTPTKRPALPAASARTNADICPGQLRQERYCYTPHTLRLAYGVEGLTEQGFTGKGQTVVDIVSFGSPTLQKDIDEFEQTAPGNN